MSRTSKRKRDLQSKRRERSKRLGNRVERDQVYGITQRPRANALWRGEIAWKVDQDPYLALSALEVLRSEHLMGYEIALVWELRRDDSASWEDIGSALGITGEAARKRHARYMEESGMSTIATMGSTRIADTS